MKHCHQGNDITACLCWMKTNGSSRNPACPLLSAMWTEAHIDLPDLLASGLSRLNVWTDADVDRKCLSRSLLPLLFSLSFYGCTLHCDRHSLVLPHPPIAAAAAAAAAVSQRRRRSPSTGTMHAFAPRWASEWRQSRHSVLKPLHLMIFNVTMLRSDRAACVCHSESRGPLWTEALIFQ